jgi:hypothetical protein
LQARRRINHRISFIKALLLATCLPGVAALRADVAAAQNGAAPLVSETVELKKETEVGLKIMARAVGASWGRQGAEAAALLITVDGVYSQDLLLWAGDAPYAYQIMLGRLPAGRHEISVTLNERRSAAGARQVEIKGIQPIIYAPSAERGAGAIDALAISYAPFLYARSDTIGRFSDVPLLMYYEKERAGSTDMLIRYTIIFSNEDGGTDTAALMARWGRTTDIEWVYEIRVRAGRVIEETYQGVGHKTKAFAGSRLNGAHPLLAVASNNNNFSDDTSSEMRFALWPLPARLNSGSREVLMDAMPWLYRTMAEELMREGRIGGGSLGPNMIADPREYLYIEAYAEQEGTALAFDVYVNGSGEIYHSDGGEARLRIDRSGYFRSAVRLPPGVSPASISRIVVRCYATDKAAARRLARRVGLTKVFMLDGSYTPRDLSLRRSQRETLIPGEAATFSLVPYSGHAP